MVTAELNHRELDRYVRRVPDRFPVERALLGGARVDDANGAPEQRERGPEYVVILVSPHFDGVPWLERVYQASSLGTRTRWARAPRCTATRPSSTSARSGRCRACAAPRAAAWTSSARSAGAPKWPPNVQFSMHSRPGSRAVPMSPIKMTTQRNPK